MKNKTNIPSRHGAKKDVAFDASKGPLSASTD
jgi:hypothetical protein